MGLAKNPIENLVEKRLTTAYIRAETTEVVLMRSELEKTAAGGLRRLAPTPLEAQRVRLVPFKRRLTKITRDTPEGDVINLPYVLMGEPDMDIQVGDSFEYEDAHYAVESLEPNRAFRTLANITYFGKQVDDAWSG